MLRLRRPFSVALVAVAVAGGATVMATNAPLNGPATATRPALRVNPPNVAPPSPTQNAAYVVFELTNQERARRGLAPYVWNTQVANSAQNHAADMAARRNMSHQGSDGSNAGQRLQRAGFSWTRWGENIAAGYTTSAAVVAAWMASPGHLPNMIGPSRFLGVGLATSSDGTLYWAFVVAS